MAAGLVRYGLLMFFRRKRRVCQEAPAVIGPIKKNAAFKDNLEDRLHPFELYPVGVRVLIPEPLMRDEVDDLLLRARAAFFLQTQRPRPTAN